MKRRPRIGLAVDIERAGPDGAIYAVDARVLLGWFAAEAGRDEAGLLASWLQANAAAQIGQILATAQASALMSAQVE